MKYNTKITDANGGNHSTRHTKAAWAWIDKCVQEYKSPRLYHVVFANTVDAEGWAGYSIHKAILKDLMQKLRRKGIKATYRAAKEIDTKEDGKGEHLHCYIICESRYYDPDSIINRKTLEDRGWLVPYANKRKVRVWLNAPQNKTLHGLANYMALPKSDSEKVHDAKVWITYLYKRRDKPTSGEVYTASRTRHTKAKGARSRLVAQHSSAIASTSLCY